jgi:hypothetical protein
LAGLLGFALVALVLARRLVGYLRGESERRQSSAAQSAHAQARIEKERLAFARLAASGEGEGAEVASPADEAETALEAFGRARGFRVVSPLAIAGDVRGVRVAIERTGDAERSVCVDVDARHASKETLESLRVRLEPRLAGYQLVRLGPIARVEWVEGDGAGLDAERLEEVLEAMVEVSARTGGAYR